MKTLILTNMNALTAIYSQKALDIQHAVETFAQTHNAQVLDINQVYQEKTGQHLTVPKYPNATLTTIAKEIKAEVISQTDGQLDFLILVGDESVIPMWEVHLDEMTLHTDSFYSDLDGDGLPEVAMTRVLGNPEAMQRQLSDTTETGGPEATILCSEDTRIHLETQRFLDALAQQGHDVSVLGRGGAERLSQSDLIIHFGHGSPQSLRNRFGEDFVTAKSMPTLPRHPIAIVDGCATTPPGSELLHTFLNNGGRAYLGSTETVLGMIPARHTNQLVMHFLDAYQAHPDWYMAQLLTVARAEYARVTRLSEVLLELEETGTLHQSEERSINTHLLTFLEWHAYGTPFARFHQGATRPIFSKHPLVATSVSLEPREQNAVEGTFDLTDKDGQPILFLRADWLNSTSAALTLQIYQNEQILHKLQGDAHIIYQRIEDICVGGYIDGDLYHAYWLLPLKRKVGKNHLRVELASGETMLTLLPESVIEIWPEWETVTAPQE